MPNFQNEMVPNQPLTLSQQLLRLLNPKSLLFNCSCQTPRAKRRRKDSHSLWLSRQSKTPSNTIYKINKFSPIVYLRRFKCNQSSHHQKLIPLKLLLMSNPQFLSNLTFKCCHPQLLTRKNPLLLNQIVKRRKSLMFHKSRLMLKS